MNTNTPDVALGSFVFCSQHCCAHSTGWCTVGNEDKIALKATTIEEAIEEARPILLSRIEKSIKRLDEIPPIYSSDVRMTLMMLRDFLSDL